MCNLKQEEKFKFFRRNDVGEMLMKKRKEKIHKSHKFFFFATWFDYFQWKSASASDDAKKDENWNFFIDTTFERRYFSLLLLVVLCNSLFILCHDFSFNDIDLFYFVSNILYCKFNRQFFYLIFFFLIFIFISLVYFFTFFYYYYYF